MPDIDPDIWIVLYAIYAIVVILVVAELLGGIGA